MDPVRIEFAVSLDSGAVAALAALFRQVWDEGTAGSLKAVADQIETVGRRLTVGAPTTGHRAAGGEERADKPRPRLIGVRDVARLLNISARHVDRMRDAGRLPRPVRIGQCVRWDASELQKWLDDGCPNLRANPTRGR